jgi:Prolipoprotein diacylglyceryl transferase/Metallo-beta-lactamase superfamily
MVGDVAGDRGQSGVGEHGVVGLWAFADALAPGLVLAQAIGRFGNYFNQELYGAPTTRPWALRIDPAHRHAATPDVALYHPTFLYESLWCVGVFFLLIWAEKRSSSASGVCSPSTWSRTRSVARGWRRCGSITPTTSPPMRPTPARAEEANARPPAERTGGADAGPRAAGAGTSAVRRSATPSRRRALAGHLVDLLLKGIGTGTVEIHPEHPYGTRQPLYWWLLTSRRWTLPRPINAYVIEHAKRLILVDTGQDRASVTDPSYFPGGVTGFVYDRPARFHIGEEEMLTAQLATLGYAPADVDTAILSHLQQDHIGGLPELARVSRIS